MADRFIDIASYQDVTNGAAVASTGVKGAWIKLTGETGYENPKRVQQIDSLRNAGLAVGGYHFGDPRIDAIGQARHFGNDARARGVLEEGSLFPMFDAENAGFTWTAGGLNTYIRVWRDVLRAEFGVLDFLVYGSESWWCNGMIDPDVWGDDHAWNWVANYNDRPGQLTLGWSHPQDALHQWRSDAVPFPGIVSDGLDDNVTLRGHTRESLTIGDTVPNISQSDLDKLLAAADKITHLFDPTDDDRPLPIATADDLAGHVLSIRGLQEKMRNAEAIDRVSIAATEGLCNQILAALQNLAVAGQTQEGFDNLFRTSPLTKDLLRDGAVFIDNDPPVPPQGG
jgi:lysozyme